MAYKFINGALVADTLEEAIAIANHFDLLPKKNAVTATIPVATTATPQPIPKIRTPKVGSYYESYTGRVIRVDTLTATYVIPKVIKRVGERAFARRILLKHFFRNYKEVPPPEQPEADEQ